MKTAIVTDSTAYIPQSLREQLHIEICPLNVIFESESYQEELELTADDFYEKVRNVSELPKTSQPAIGLFEQTFKNLAKKGYEAVISIHLSSGISGTFQASVTAGGMVDEILVYSFDSEISCMPQGFYAIEAAEMALQGKEPKKILERLNEMKKSMCAYFMVDDLAHLQRGGRLNGAQALIGSLLQVKPILHFEDAKIVPFEKIRTHKKAIKRILELFDEDAKTGVPIKASLIHANRLDIVEELKNQIQSEYKNVEIDISYFGAVIGTHLGEGAIGLGWYKK
ncbi:DegV family protein [Schinkia azotoformans]|uniref:DegV family protein n=1 Tax=Schinkia azotoformans LMG 9581 TaxID=1131731 RepID=K6DH78_SCHAZ|nr:DegV family protein [Schinkia azotoformans]EKN67659.1 degV family protein [Schinkia azotoformans LMG 9581]MEC1637569.1 DegV family protein [Schinkia azotoformans]MEC1943973.1 DegV family protein [Schinkia azotoformans]